MKRIDLVKELEKLGFEFIRQGAKHDWYQNPRTGVAQPVPRHREIPKGTARNILKMLANPPEEADEEAEADS
jgi:predicted RNA binding protein YcfA (HicA-like mRNA interferase family)